MGSTGGPERLLLGGCSSGGAGALVTLDYVSQWVTNQVSVHGLLDAALFLDMLPVAPGAAMPLSEQTAELLAYANGTGRSWPACLQAWPGPRDAWRCVFGQYRLPYVKVPYLLSQPLWEAAQLRGDEGGVPPPYAPGTREAAFANAFGAAARAQLVQLPAPNQGGSSVFAPACYAGCLSLDSGFTKVSVD